MPGPGGAGGEAVSGPCEGAVIAPQPTTLKLCRRGRGHGSHRPGHSACGGAGRRGRGQRPELGWAAARGLSLGDWGGGAPGPLSTLCQAWGRPWACRRFRGSVDGAFRGACQASRSRSPPLAPDLPGPWVRGGVLSAGSGVPWRHGGGGERGAELAAGCGDLGWRGGAGSGDTGTRDQGGAAGCEQGRRGGACSGQGQEVHRCPSGTAARDQPGPPQIRGLLCIGAQHPLPPAPPIHGVPESGPGPPPAHVRNTWTHSHTTLTYTRSHTHARTHTHSHTRTCTHAHTLIHTLTLIHACASTRTHAHTHIHTLAHARTCTHMHTHASC